MKLLLDTHFMLWAMQGRAAVPKAALPWMEEADEIIVSAASVWEAAIKASLGKLRTDIDTLERRLDDAGFASLPVTWRHAAMVRRLPMHHRDPFDRLLVAQAISEPLRLLTCDRQLATYSELVTVI